jgi:hypothetical protein
VAIFGWPPLPPRSSLQKIVYVALIGLVIGIALDALNARQRTRLVALVWPGVVVAWIGWQQLIGLNALDLARLAVLWVAGAFIFDRLFALRDTDIAAPTLVLVAGLGVSLVAFLGAAASLSQLAAATAAGIAGFLLWNWPKLRYPFSATTMFGIASALFGVGVAIVLFTRASTLAMAILLLTFATGEVRRVVPFFARPVWGPVAFGVAAAIPVLLAIAVAVTTAASAD